ncbi:hypothetical protein AB0M57_23985 [Streptomyces sp. NPDC051597]|uniref:hypothetical protein n=1 Tax=Streptomyces sp. NPDC051597 TaxID=3155049 RepID=UPI003449D746
MLEVTALFLGSTVVGLLAGVMLVVLGMAPVAAIGAGAGAFVGAFTLGLSTISYVKKQG